MILLCVAALLFIAPATVSAQAPYVHGNCSEAFVICDKLANCVEEKSNFTFQCICGDGSKGDGLKAGTACFYDEQPCIKNEDCHVDGFCDLAGSSVCKCKSGYVGNGVDACTDIDECLSSPCDPNANCQNQIGDAPTCTCKAQYAGDGFSCIRVCSIKAECHNNADCINTACICNSGYSGDGLDTCDDIDECVTGDFTCTAPATCKNAIGSYTCGCPNGFTGDGVTCTALYKNCHEIYLNDASAVTGRMFEIDPDGTGPIESLMAKCEFRDSIGITIVSPVNTAAAVVSSTETTIVYKDATVQQLKQLADTSPFCYQSQRLQCSGGYNLFQGNSMEWKDADGNPYKTWGGSDVDGMCPCGVLGYCDQGVICNCDGTSTGNGEDYGKIINSSMLPIATVQFPTGSGSATYIISDMVCAPSPVDILKDCDEIKLSGVNSNGPQLIDIDGPAGALDPTLVHCDMKKYSHVGLTIIPHDKKSQILPTVGESIQLNYVTPDDIIAEILSVSTFCSQEVRYECRNAPINFDNTQMVFVGVGNDSRQLDYFPGGQGVANNCGCGITCSCIDRNITCNCDMNDNVTRYDIANHITKADMPITSIYADMSESEAYSMIYIGPLVCAEQQFGIEPNCEKYRSIGVSEPYSYLIDPDGPADPQNAGKTNLPPFEAECKFNANPPQGVTILHHDTEDITSVTNAQFFFAIDYKRIIDIEQVKSLKLRSTFCGQSLDFSCKNYKLHLTGSAGVLWKDMDGNIYRYLSGGAEGDTGCRCNVEEALNCADGNEICNCDAAAGGPFMDDGELGNITHLPVASLDFSEVNSQILSVNTNLEFTLGPLTCFETFPTCYDLSEYLKTQALIGEAVVEPGKYTIDPDRSGDNPPFTVTCDFPFTIVGVSPAPTSGPAKGETQCYTVEYLDFNNNSISASQIASLVKSSGYCRQFLSYTCQNAPWTGNVNFSSCDGKSQEGWALSGGHDTCACGLTGTCVGGLNDNCNCDTADATTRKDEGQIYNTTRLPVCEVCLTLEAGGGSNMYSVGGLSCSGTGFVGENSCQDKRVTFSTNIVTYINPQNSKPVVPVYCNMQASPAIGIMEFRLNQTIFTIQAGAGIDVMPQYLSYDKVDMEKLIDNSYYCTQDIFITCNDGSLDLYGANGWYSRADIAQDSWGGNIGKTLKCEGIGTNCNCNKAGSQTDGGILGDKSLLPISRVVLGSSPTERTLTIEPVKCYELRPDCFDIMKSGNLKTPYSGSRYIIDPDGPDGVDPFVVKCTFQNNINNAISEVVVQANANTVITGKVAGYSFMVPIQYKETATPEQINALTRQAPFCYQNIVYKCTKSPINGSVQYLLNDGTISPSFGTGYDTNETTCPCKQLGTCEGYACRCDEKRSVEVMDSGTITDKNVLPITIVAAGGQVDAGATSTLSVSSVKCEEKPTDFPKNCEAAKAKGLKTGEIMIYPTTSLPPFFVYCDMEINPGHGTAVINPIIAPETKILYDGVPIDVPYKGLTDAEVQALVTASSYCYQPVKYNCKSTKFLADNKFSWTSIDASSNTYFGAGTQANKDCTCGNENLCGGDGGKTVMEQRSCNCGIGDTEERADSGIVTNKNDLPIRSLIFQPTGIAGSEGNITLGQLYCGQNTIAFNECSLGFHDCHYWADCVDTASGFDCVCPVLYRGLGVPNTLSSGRQCYDDDECAFNPCPSTATCYNTPGSFYCTCNDGYHHLDPLTCQDNEECTDPQYPNNCDINAKCINTEGSFYCRCKRGYRGEGTNGTCIGVGICACFGDPHCISFDDKWLNFMGKCQYIMAQDGCDGSPRTFSVWTHNWDMNTGIQGITWVKDVTVQINNTRIYLGPDRVIRVNGREFLGYRRDGISVDDNGREVVITTTFGLEVFWDGGDEVEILLSNDFKGKMCGLCGNYNADIDDDWTIGDYCTATKGTITTNENIFGHSWVVSQYLVDNPTCSADCNAPPTDNTVCNDPVFNYYCDRVFDPTISPFSECLDFMEADLIQNLKFSCIFDICHVSQDIEIGMCSSAERVVNECNKNLNSDIGTWRKLGFCELSCKENEEYRTCGPRNNPEKTRQTLCFDVRKGQAAPLLGYCAEGCYCVPGFVLEGQDCILPSDCGCVVDGVYLAIAQTYINDDCTTLTTCLQGGSTTNTAVACDSLAYCGVSAKAIFGCHCNDGYKGDGYTCGEDNCFNVTCAVNMECKDAECQCKIGYVGDCNRCDDIDECATKTDNCIHLGQNCTNTDGSYTCACISGYVPYGHFCLDIDECEAGFDTCSTHSECVNHHGGFTCECCAGYVKTGESCVSDGSTVTNAAKCCSCNGPGCTVAGKVCGDDGNTYNNERALRVAACKTDIFVDVSYKGNCQSDCSGIICEKPYEVCAVDIVHGKAQCECPKCDTLNNPVCSSRLLLFQSQCEFERLMCEVNDFNSIIESDVSLCNKAEGDAVSPWSAWGACSVDCGAGEMTRIRSELRTRTTYELTILALEEMAICYGNCTNGPCSNYTCPGFGEVCVPSVDNLTPECICPNCTYREDDPVCGLVCDRQSTFKNKCELQKKACEVNQRPHLLSESACGALPLNCSLYSKYQDLSEGTCVNDPIAVGVCEGGCGLDPDFCCESVESDMLSYNLMCSNGSTVTRQVFSILSCKCNDLAGI